RARHATLVGHGGGTLLVHRRQPRSADGGALDVLALVGIRRQVHLAHHESSFFRLGRQCKRRAEIWPKRTKEPNLPSSASSNEADGRKRRRHRDRGAGPGRRRRRVPPPRRAPQPQRLWIGLSNDTTRARRRG